MRVDGRFRNMDRGQTSKRSTRPNRHGSSQSRPSTWKVNNEQHSPSCTRGEVPTRLALRHSRQLEFCSMPYRPSTSLRSLRSIPVTELLRYYGRSDSCPIGSSVAWRQHEHRLCLEQVSLLHAPELPIPPSPTTPSLLTSLLHVTPQLVEFPDCGSRLHHCLAGSPALVGRIEFVNLRMDSSPPAAPHPASRQRSCIRLQAGERIPEGDFHPSVQYYKCALAGALDAATLSACFRSLWRLRKNSSINISKAIPAIMYQPALNPFVRSRRTPSI